VLEVPDHLIGDGLTHGWATASLYGHAPEVQVSRWGLPLITHLFLNDPGKQEVKEEFNRAAPSEDSERFSDAIGEFVEKVTTYRPLPSRTHPPLCKSGTFYFALTGFRVPDSELSGSQVLVPAHRGGDWSSLTAKFSYCILIGTVA
jgi:hypothetical protein